MYGYKTNQSISKFITELNGVTSSLTGEIIFSVIENGGNDCKRDEYEGRAECF